MGRKDRFHKPATDLFACDVPTAFRLPPPGRECELERFPVFAPLPDWPEQLPPRPRLALTPERIEATRRDIEAGFLHGVWERIWQAHLENHPGSPEEMRQPDRGHAYILSWRAMRWALLRDERALQEATAWLEAIASSPIADHRESLASGEVLATVALSLDWIGDDLPEGTAAAVRRWMAAEAAQVARAAEIGAVWWADCWLQNHLIVNECGIGLAGMALADAPEPQLRQVGLDLYRHALTCFRKAVFFQPPDGSSPELCRYAYFMYEAQLLFFEALLTFSGESLYGDFARRRIDYILQQLIPLPTLAGDLLNWGDNSRDTWPHPPTSLLYCLARRYRHTLAQGAADWLVSRGVGMAKNKSWLIPLFRDPVLQGAAWPPVDGTLPASYHAEDQGLITMRSSWSEDAAMVGVLCGPFQGHRLLRVADKDMGAAHRHPDNGAFQICAGSTYLTVDPGYEYLKNTGNHNTILIDGQGQTGDGNTWYNVNNSLNRERQPLGIVRFEDLGDVCHVLADVTGAYDADLEVDRFQRRFLFVRPDLLVIHDRLSGAVPHEYRWLLHTDPGDAFTEVRPGYWRLQANGAAMDICLPELGEEMERQVRLYRIPRSRFVKQTRRLELYNAEPRTAVDFLVVLRIRRGRHPQDTPPADIRVERDGRAMHLRMEDLRLTWPVDEDGAGPTVSCDRTTSRSSRPA